MEKAGFFTKEIGIVVEGENDREFIFRLCEKLGLANFEVKKVSGRGGKTDFFGKQNNFNIDKISALVDKTSENPKNLLLICDADFTENKKSYDGFQNTKSTLQPIVSRLKKKFKNKEISFFILPNNKDDGNLDSLFLECANSKVTKKLNCVDDYLKCLGEKPSINKKDKLYAQLLISATGHQKDYKNVGDVADEKAGYWNFDHKSLDPLKKFLNKIK